MTRIAISGASGRMGRALIQATSKNEATNVTAAIERPGKTIIGVDAGELAGIDTLGVKIVDDLSAVTDDFDVLIDLLRLKRHKKISKSAAKQARKL